MENCRLFATVETDAGGALFIQSALRYAIQLRGYGTHTWRLAATEQPANYLHTMTAEEAEREREA